MIRLAICDDEKKILEDMSRKVRTAIDGAEVSLYSNGMTLLEDIKRKEEGFDILLLDIDMPEISGLEIAETIQHSEKKPLIIFVTSHDELVYDSLQLHPFGFVRKSYLDKELSRVLEDAIREISSKEKNFYFHTAEGDIRLSLKDILYFEAQGNYIRVVTGSEEYRFRETMQALEMALSTDGFVRTHKGFLVNSEAVKIINSDKLILDDKTEIPVGRSYQETAKRSLMRGMLR